MKLNPILNIGEQSSALDNQTASLMQEIAKSFVQLSISLALIAAMVASISSCDLSMILGSSLL
jgi:hypothetical protein